MRKKFERLFGGWSNEAPGKDPSVPDLRVAVAALLLYVGMADFELIPEERDRAAALLEDYFHLPAGEASGVMDEAARQLREKIDIYTFTSRIDQALTREERIPIMEMVWQIIYADHRLEGNEDQVAHRLAGLLGLDHSQMIAAKIKVSKGLE
jgi:uncharacterized tellurite resistance protein B-like protein